MASTRHSASGVARRYAPLIAGITVMALVVTFAPSKSATRHGQGVPAVGRAGEALTDPVAVSAGAHPEGGALVEPGNTTGPPPTAAVTADGRSSDSTTAPGRLAAPAVPMGSTAHCVAGRQFDPKIDFYSPPCVPRSAGTNPGATAQGVTADEILLIDYWIDPGAVPSTFFRAQDLFAAEDEQARFDEAVERFINANYELHGRKVRIELWRSDCPVQPPDPTCFRADAAELVADKKPFAVVNSTVAPVSFFFDELSQRRTVNVGGWQLPDTFGAARAPYHWDPNISGTRMAQTFAGWYCSRLHGRPVQYAGDPHPPGRSFTGRPRVLGVIGLNDPEHKKVVESVLEPALARCGAKVAHTYFIEPNLARAEEQNQAAITTMQSEPEATALLCICGPAMGQFHAAMQERNYYPEQLMPGNSMTDLDSVAQSFSGPLGCPSRSNCQAENMFGLSQFGPPTPRFQGVGARIWKAAGNRGDPPYARVDLDWAYWSLLASLIQAAGPDLTAAALEQAAAALPARGGGATSQPLRRFRPGSHHWIQDMRVVYWSTTKASPYNGTAGTWVQVGDRFEPGASPIGALVLPPKPR